MEQKIYVNSVSAANRSMSAVNGRSVGAEIKEAFMHQTENEIQ